MAGFFNYSKPGKGLSKEDVDKNGIELYVDIFLRRIWKMATVNLLFLVASIPALVIGWFLTVNAIIWLSSATNVPLDSSLATSLSSLGITVTFVLLLLLGSGPASAGMNYVMRRYVNDTHSWVFSDFADNLKSNFRQSICVYVINILATCFFATSAVFYLFVMKGLLGTFMFSIVVAGAAIFVMMQMYTYQLMVSFRLKVKDIYKNAFLLVLAKLPWNVFTAAVCGGIVYGVYYLMITLPVVGDALVIAILYALITFTQIFMTNNIVKKYLLDNAQTACENEVCAEESMEN